MSVHLHNTENSNEESKAQAEVVNSANMSLERQAGDFSLFSRTSLLAIVAIVWSVAGVGLSFYNKAEMEQKLALVEARYSAGLTSVQVKQRSMVAGDSVGAGQPNPQTDIKAPENAPRLGKKDAKVEIIEFSDFQCPFCERFFTEIYPKIKTEYIDTGKASFVYQNFAFLGDESVNASNSALCANEQGKFWEFHDLLFSNQAGENQGGFNLDKIKKLAVKVSGLDKKAFNTCLDAKKYTAQIQEEQIFGRKYGVTGTPSTFINGYRIVGAQNYETFKAQIEKALAE